MYFVAVRLQKLEEYDYPVFDLHYSKIRNSYTEQRRLQDKIGIIAPTMPLRSISMGFAGTDLIHHTKFMDDAEAHRRNMVVKMNDYLSKAAVSLNATFSASNYMTADEEVFSIVPPFVYEPPSLSETLEEHWSNFGLLLLWLVASIGFAVYSVNRLSVERT
jgi:ABC-2 type transport system permease protein